MQDHEVGRQLEHKLKKAGFPLDACTIDVSNQVYYDSNKTEGQLEYKIRYFVGLNKFNPSDNESVCVFTEYIPQDTLDDSRLFTRHQLFMEIGFDIIMSQYETFKKIRDGGLCLLHIKSEDNLLRKLCKREVL